jgi:hypothetical protein
MGKMGKWVRLSLKSVKNGVKRVKGDKIQWIEPLLSAA